MYEMRRSISITAAVLVLGLLVATAVSAGFVEGTGTLRAQGAGIARVAGDGHVDIRGHAVGTVWVRNAEELSASGRTCQATWCSLVAGREKSVPAVRN